MTATTPSTTSTSPADLVVYDDPQEHARDVIDAMRDLDTSTPEAEQALRGAGLGLQRTLNRIYGPARGVR